MKPAQTPQAAPEVPVRVEFQVQFSGGPKGRRRPHEETTTPSAQHETPAAATRTSAPEPVKRTSPNHVPKITQLLVLGHHFEALIREGVVKDYAEIARLTGLSRARVTQITNLTLLAPEIQEAILRSPSTVRGHDPSMERDLRQVVAEVNWREQISVWS